MKVTIAICALLIPLVFGKEGREGKDYLGHVYHPTPVVVPRHPPLVAPYHPEPVPTCHVVYETRYTTRCKNIHRPAYKPCVEYRKEYQTQCHIAPKTCHPVTTTVPDEACHTEKDKHCTVEVKTTYDVSYQDQCEDIEHKVCKHTKVVGAYKRPLVVAHPVIGRRVYKRSPESAEKTDSREGKSYGALPLAPLGPNCQVQVERQCHKVPVKVPRHIEIPHCTKVPRLKCIPSFRTITDNICKDVPREVCADVEVKVPFDVPIEYCPPVTEEVCHKVPHQYAKEVCPKTKPHY